MNKKELGIWIVSGVIVLVVAYAVLFYQQLSQYKTQIDFLKNCNSYSKVAKISLDNYSENSKSKLEVTDTYHVKEIMLGICNAKNVTLSSREGPIRTRSMHIILTDGQTITLQLSKDNRNKTSIEYRPNIFTLIDKETTDLCFLFGNI